MRREIQREQPPLTEGATRSLTYTHRSLYNLYLMRESMFLLNSAAVDEGELIVEWELPLRE